MHKSRSFRADSLKKEYISPECMCCGNRAHDRGAEEVQNLFYKTNHIFLSTFLHFPVLEACKTINFERRQAPLRADHTNLRGAH